MDKAEKFSFYCNDCNYKTNEPTEYAQHCVNHVGEYTYNCIVCTYKSNSKRLYTQHYRRHFGKFRFHCEYCDFKTNEKGYFNQHTMNHLGEYQFRCNECEFKTNDKSYYNQHMLNHSGEYKYHCKDCPYKTNIRCNFTQHCMTHLGKYKFQCLFCDYKSNYKNRFVEHNMKHSGEYKFHCGQCKYKTNIMSNFTRHTMNHSKIYKFQCTECDFKTNIKKSFQQHNLDHAGKYEFNCNDCDFKTNDQSAFIKHNSKHSGEYRFHCTYCEYKTNDKSYFTKHSMNHIGEYRFHCIECNYKTNERSNFYRHNVKHTGKYRFTCKYCDYKTNAKGNFNQHSKIHSEEEKEAKSEDKTDEKEDLPEQYTDLSGGSMFYCEISEFIFSCSYCEYKTNSKETLSEHELSHKQGLPNNPNILNNVRKKPRNRLIISESEYPENLILYNNPYDFVPNIYPPIPICSTNEVETLETDCISGIFDTSILDSKVKNPEIDKVSYKIIVTSSLVPYTFIRNNFKYKTKLKIYKYRIGKMIIRLKLNESTLTKYINRIYYNYYRFHCIDCDYLARKYSFLFKHQEKHIAGNDLVSEENIPENNSDLCNFNKLSTSCKDDFLLQCDSCDYITDQILYLVSHEMEHTKEKSFHCLSCPFKAFQRLSFLKHHNKHLINKIIAS